MSGNNQQPSRQSSTDLYRLLFDERPPEEVSPSGELLRAVERHYGTGSIGRHSGLGNANDDILQLPPTASSSRDAAPVPHRNLQRRFSREPTRREPNSLPSPTPSPSLPPLRSSRRGPIMSSGGGGGIGGSGIGGSGSVNSRLGRYRPSERYSLRSSPANSTSTSNPIRLPDEVRLDSSSNFRYLLDFNNTIQRPPSPPLSTPPIHSQDAIEDSRRVKRRKIDSAEDHAPAFKGFRYGRYGQVEPGQLTMEIVSCDGGMYSEGSGSSTYAAENILKNDATVYCTKSSKCNIVLRHQGATVFSLKELVIKAPGSNYSSPVREGMVFIAMDNDGLFKRTTEYQIQYSYVRYWGRNGPDDHLPSVVSIRHNQDGTLHTRVSGRQRRMINIGDDADRVAVAQIPSEFTVSPPPFRVTTECSDEDDGAGGGGGDGRHRRRTPNRIGSLPFESDSSDDWVSHYDEFNRDPLSLGHFAQPATIGGHNSSSGGHNSGHQTLDEAVEASQLATQEAVQAVGGKLMAPHAHFFVETDKSKCTIRFDPPVSGRFILLKMWSSHADPASNIDIQGVVAKGFAGPRFFPATELL